MSPIMCMGLWAVGLDHSTEKSLSDNDALTAHFLDDRSRE